MEPLDWSKIFLNDLNFSLALEIILRTFVMFVLILTILRLSGKRGIRQLSLFEVAIILSLGSAAGDPMMTEDMAIIPSVIVFLTIILLYRTLTFLTAKRENIEKLVEGKPIYIVEDGMLALEGIKRDTLAKDEFFSELRQYGIEHLGQVKTAILETSGSVSVYYFPDDSVKPGLPILPKLYEKRSPKISISGLHACSFCGNVVSIQNDSHKCMRCESDEWVETLSSKRIV
ncbi:Uncharacterized membrane protein YcaP, DUF421 family [Olivibacter domesticus]|uniref:Uncharacterized membrane protein YcaP, DUF421 family n=1 Tax=Olivibacter domesticus TaxID=407022 RepID=A0A1H7KZA6_OLID1|nr:Uncharacterized membrane protein YcaP, DUF421 family [Olivibacter domesticus]